MSRAVLILGMHRSGTSALAGALQLAGVDLGHNLTPGREDNPRGFFEHDDVWRVHEDLLKALGSDWHDVRSLPSGWQRTEAAAQAASTLNDVLHRDFATSELWGVKDPRASRLFNLWPGLVQGMGADLHVVLALRHPLETARSLSQRNKMRLSYGLALWLRYTLEAERATRQQRRVVQNYQDFLADWEEELARLDNTLGLCLPTRTPEQNAQIADFLDAGLRHQDALGNWPGEDDVGPISPWCAEAYAAMLAAPSESSSATLDAIAAELDRWEWQADALCGEVGYHLAEQHQQSGTIRWLDGVRADLLDQLRREAADRQAAQLALAQTLRSLEEGRGGEIDQRHQGIAECEARHLALTETIRSLQEERGRLLEDRLRDVVDREAQRVALAAAVRSLTAERDRLIDDRRKDAADHQAEWTRQAETILSLKREQERLVSSWEREKNRLVVSFTRERDELVSSLTRERDELVSSLTHQRGELAETLHREQLKDSRNETDRMLASRRIETLEMTISDVQSALDAAYRSRSWRVTAPMRRIKALLFRMTQGKAKVAPEATKVTPSVEIPGFTPGGAVQPLAALDQPVIVAPEEFALDDVVPDEVTAGEVGATEVGATEAAATEAAATEAAATGAAAAEASPAEAAPDETAAAEAAADEAALDIVAAAKQTRHPIVKSLRGKYRILIVTPDIHGPIRNGGIGTAFHALAMSFVQWGHEVTVLYALGDYTESEPVAYWQNHYRDRGVDLIPLDSSALGVIPELQGSYCSQSAWKVHLWLRLREQDFDLAIFPEWMGLAYYVLVCKGHGLAYGGLTIVVNAHSPEAWSIEGNRALPDNPDVLDREFMERETVKRADWLISPSEYMFDWMLDHRWQLSERREVIQNLLSETSIQEETRSSGLDVSEIVFFGRLEIRKGLTVFCDAIDKLLTQNLHNLDKIVFLGKESGINGIASTDYIEKRSQKWSIKFEVQSDLNREQALDYLSRSGVLAVIASISENSPYTVLECLYHRICFVASSVGGIPELIHSDDHDSSLFDPNPGALAQKLLDILEHGPIIARMAHPQEETRERWLAWLEQVGRAQPAQSCSAADQLIAAEPLVSVCLVHYNRPQLLAQALDSLRNQTYGNFEVVLVDDGSPSEVARAFLTALEPEFEARGWQIIRQRNRYLGAARNRAAEAARGSYLLFMDDDNIALPNELEVFVEAALHSGADILTCVAQLFHGEAPPGQPDKMWLPLGGAVGAGLYRNVYGDANALWRRDVFVQVGGYTTDYGVGHEDWELFADAILSGFRLELVPEPLFWYRIHASSMLRTGDVWADHARSVRPYIRHDPFGLGLATAYAVCMQQRRVVSANVYELEAQVADWRNHAYVPVMGHIKVQEVYEPPFTDGWVGRSVSLRIEPRKPVLGLMLLGWRLDNSEDEIEVTVRLQGETSSKKVGGGPFGLSLSMAEPVSADCVLSVEASAVRRASAVDGRMISFILDSIEIVH